MTISTPRYIHLSLAWGTTHTLRFFQVPPTVCVGGKIGTGSGAEKHSWRVAADYSQLVVILTVSLAQISLLRDWGRGTRLSHLGKPQPLPAL